MSADRIPADWPHARASTMVAAGGLNWHVQRFGAGPTLLLIHGTAASTHSFRELAQRLSERFEIVMADLPGHGFSGRLDAPTLPRVSQAMGDLMARLGAAPDMVAGHSAGAAVAIRMTLDGLIAPQRIIGLAPALMPYGGAADGLASKMVKLALLNPLAPRLFAMRASSRRVSELIARTGSQLDEAGAELYARLLKRSEHVAGALRLMAHWKLRPLLDDLGRLNTPTGFIVGENDRATPPRDAQAAARRIRHCEVSTLSGLGHLAHEEDAQACAELICQAWDQSQPRQSRRAGAQ